MKRLAYPRNKRFSYLVIIIVYTLYVILVALLHSSVGAAAEVLAIVPVIGASWYFGFSGGIFTAILCISNDIVQQVLRGNFHHEFPLNFGTLLIFLVLIFIAFVVGKLKMAIEERSQALLRLEQYEHARQSNTDFIVLLNQITAVALEADSLDSTLKILVEKIGKLFRADHCFFDLWDEAKGIPIAMTAHGPMSDVYSYIKFEPGENTPTTFAIEYGYPTTIEDLRTSPVIDPGITKVFLSCSMLVLPLIVQNRKLGALLLGYNKTHSSEEKELILAGLTAEQVALVLAKSLMLEEGRKQIKQLTALHDIALISIQADNEDELISRATDIIGQTLSLDHYGILLPDEQAGVLRAHSSYRLRLPEASHRIVIPLDEGVTGKVARTGRAQRIGNVRSVEEYLDVDERTISELCVPIKFKEQILGVINTESMRWDAFTEDDERLLITLAGQIATALERARLFQEVQNLALTDPLTGLHNRRSLFELGKMEFSRARRMNRAFCCMMLDLDHFKQVNDTYGHPVGDQVLKEFASRCKSSVREIDLVGRYGGEELLILLPEAERGSAMQIAERLRTSIAAKPFKVLDKEINITVSIGIAEKDENTIQLETLVAGADQAMYYAKHRGRNCVVMSE